MVLSTVGATETVMPCWVICVLVMEAGADSCCGRSASVAGEMSASERCSDGGWRGTRADHELSRRTDGVGQCRGWQPGSKVSMMIMRPPQQGQVFQSSSS